MGPRAGVLSVTGMALGMVVHVTAAAVGVDLLLPPTPWALDAARLGRGAYLGWPVVDALRGTRRAGHHGEAGRPSQRLVLRRAVLTNLRNPKGDPVLRSVPAAVRPRRPAVPPSLNCWG